MAIEFTKLANPTGTLPPSATSCCAVSASGEYIALGFNNTSPYFYCYRWDGSNYARLSDPTTPPTGNVTAMAFSPDGQYLAVSHVNSPRITIYEIDGDTLTKIANPATIPPSHGRGVCFSPDGLYLGMGHVSSPYMSIYKIVAGVFTKIANPTNLPTNHAAAFDWWEDDEGNDVIAISFTSSPYVYVYDLDRGTDTLTRRDPVSPTPPFAITQFSGLSIRRDGAHLATSHGAGSGVARLSIYDLELAVPTEIADIPDAPTVGSASSVEYGRSRDLLFSGTSSAAPYFMVWSYAGATYTRLPDLPDFPAAVVGDVQISLDGGTLIVATDASPYFALYSISESITANFGGNLERFVADINAEIVEPEGFEANVEAVLPEFIGDGLGVVYEPEPLIAPPVYVGPATIFLSGSLDAGDAAPGQFGYLNPTLTLPAFTAAFEGSAQTGAILEGVLPAFEAEFRSFDVPEAQFDAVLPSFTGDIFAWLPVSGVLGGTLEGFTAEFATDMPTGLLSILSGTLEPFSTEFEGDVPQGGFFRVSMEPFAAEFEGHVPLGAVMAGSLESFIGEFGGEIPPIGYLAGSLMPFEASVTVWQDIAASLDGALPAFRTSIYASEVPRIDMNMRLQPFTASFQSQIRFAAELSATLPMFRFSAYEEPPTFSSGGGVSMGSSSEMMIGSNIGFGFGSIFNIG